MIITNGDIGDVIINNGDIGDEIINNGNDNNNNNNKTFQRGHYPGTGIIEVWNVVSVQ